MNGHDLIEMADVERKRLREEPTDAEVLMLDAAVESVLAFLCAPLLLDLYGDGRLFWYRGDAEVGR